MIISNQVHCLKCDDKPYSANRHDFRYCKCGSVAVDGGMTYLRRVGDMYPGHTKEMSIEIPDEIVHASTAAIQEAIDTGRNPLGIFCCVMRTLRDNNVTISPQNT